jgi:lipoprotein signal peptidase
MRPAAEPSYRWLFWCLAIVGLCVDQASKYGVFHHLYNDGRGDETQILPGAFKLLAQYSGERDGGSGTLVVLRTWSGDMLPKVNRGALFGLGGHNGWLANTVFAIVSVAAALAIVYWSIRPATGRDRFLCLALGLILAGTLGNLYDRLVFGGVRDFLYWYYVIDWPVFNLADCCLVCGAGLLLLQAFVTETRSSVEQHAVIAEEPEIAEAR